MKNTENYAPIFYPGYGKLENFVNKETNQFELADNAELHENVEELAAVDDGLIQRAILDGETG